MCSNTTKQPDLPNSDNNSITLNNGTVMPYLGFGVFQIKDGRDVEKAVSFALEAGYRSIDTAAVYGNEQGVGKAIAQSGIPRKEIFLTTKVWNKDQRKKRTLIAFEESLDRLKMDYVDLYLVHWPVDHHYNSTWKDMEEIYIKGKAKAIGVSNFLVNHLEDVMKHAEVIPAVNQIEFHPYLVQPELISFCRKYKIQVEAWSPLMQGNIMNVPVIVEMAKKYKRTEAQITLRWSLQHRVVTIPKSEKAHRIKENMQIFDFELSEQDMNILDALDQGKRYGPNPGMFNF